MAIEEQVRAYGGPRFQLTQQVMNRFGLRGALLGVARVVRVVVGGGGPLHQRQHQREHNRPREAVRQQVTAQSGHEQPEHATRFRAVRRAGAMRLRARFADGFGRHAQVGTCPYRRQHNRAAAARGANPRTT